MPPIKLGANCWNQYAEWPNMLAAGQRIDRLGYDTLWTWDHLYPIVGNHEGPIFEGWMAITAWAATTERVRIGLMVGANTFRNPALTAKLATTLDHISGGRAILGIGAAWFETEHRAYGIEYGDGPPERLRWLGEALPIMRGMLHGEQPSRQRTALHDDGRAQRPAAGPGASAAAHRRRRRAGHAPAGRPLWRCEQRRRGHRCRPAQGTVLLQHCEAVGRDPSEIERTTGIGTVVIRDSEDEARRVHRSIFEHNGRARSWDDVAVGTPEQVAERLAPYLEIGYRHLIAGFPSPYDEESQTRLANEVRPLLERA